MLRENIKFSKRFTFSTASSGTHEQPDKNGPTTATATASKTSSKTIAMTSTSTKRKRKLAHHAIRLFHDSHDGT
jgi:hypothetical protein